MPESVSDRSLRGLAVPTLATLALVLVLVAGTFAALLVSVRDAAGGVDRAELQRVAHKLKGSCQNIGATFMATLCRSIETAEGDVAGALAELDAALAPTEAALRRALAVSAARP